MNKSNQKASPKLKPYLVTTKVKGVFFGYHTGPTDNTTVTLKDAQMCIYWPKTCKGVLGLASFGPLEGSKISPIVPSITLQEVTAMVECTEEAEILWKNQPWS